MFTSRYYSFLHRAAVHHARLFLVLGVFAVLMQSLASMGLMGSHQGKSDSDGKFFAEICTVLGVSNAQATRSGVAGDKQSPSDSSNTHDCCKLCVASGALLFANTTLAVSPAPTFHASLSAFISARPASFAWTAHPPRGPPART
ncbi:hypothetical protein PG1C_03410 [Rugosibacter aromaticivorans]|uniref:DUF2946 domain-containing protein n=1 Tax=Rugosibacter aromaticivorans TaxID=1565605 RepID=A0A0C5J756_9PROT|nr:DUF2946 domain-containing protein [Rugosibacter aromaticivorans]AJP47770.1 hypothetical protein PG1C_03410 [Rugosibacter aromaticivorans]